MSTFSYRGFNAAGESCKGVVEAETPKLARTALKQQGILVETLQQPTARPLSMEVRADIYRELGTLFAGGVTIPDALNIMAGEGAKPRRRVAMLMLREKLQGGASLSAAMASLQLGCSAFEAAALEAAERSGELAGLLDELAGLLEQQCKVRERILSALLYPSLVFLLGLVVAVTMLGVLLPRAARMVEGTTVALPALTRGMVAAGRLSPLLLAILLCVAAAAWLLLRVRPRAERVLLYDRILLRLPLIGKARVQLCAMRLCNTLAMLLRGGVPLVDALTLAGDASGSAHTAQQLRINAATVRDGGRVSDALGALDPMGASLIGWVRVGETGGDLERMLRTAASRFALQWERRVSRTLALLEPALILLIGAFVLLVTLSVLMPVLSLSRSVG